MAGHTQYRIIKHLVSIIPKIASSVACLEFYQDIFHCFFSFPPRLFFHILRDVPHMPVSILRTSHCLYPTRRGVLQVASRELSKWPHFSMNYPLLSFPIGNMLVSAPISRPGI